MKPTLVDWGKTENDPIAIKTVDAPHLDNPFHFHPYCELVLILQGNGQRVVGDSIDNYFSNDLVLIGPNLPHIWRDERSDTPENTKSVVIYFSTSVFDQLTDEQTLIKMKKLLSKACRGLKINGSLLEEVKSHMQAIVPLTGLAKTLQFIKIIDLILSSQEYTPLAGASYQNIFTTKDAMRVDKVYRYIIDNFKRTITLDEIAEVANLTPNSFCRFFKQASQKSFSQFVNEMRISYACKLLNDKDLPINQISSEAGFQNITNFNRFFKAITGVTPKQYRSGISSLTRDA